jgi:hypothetical protein
MLNSRSVIMTFVFNWMSLLFILFLLKLFFVVMIIFLVI